MPQPLVDILIPTYNPNPDHLRAALKSLLAQTEDRWTALVHDDASDFDVQAQIALALQDPRIRFVRSEHRHGIGGNWNACLKYLTDAPYVQFLFQDDVWNPEYLERSVHILERNPEISFTVADHIYTYEGMDQSQPFYEALLRERHAAVSSGKHDGIGFLRSWLEHGLHPNLIGEPSFVMLRKHLIDRVGFFREDMPQFLDVEYWTRCLIQGDWYFLKENLGSFRVHRAGASAQNEEAGSGIYDRFRCFQELIKKLPEGELRSEAIAARNRTLDTMVQKFFGRVKAGKQVKAAGSGLLMRFILRHPMLFAGAFMRSIHSSKD